MENQSWEKGRRGKKIMKRKLTVKVQDPSTRIY